MMGDNFTFISELTVIKTSFLLLEVSVFVDLRNLLYLRRGLLFHSISRLDSLEFREDCFDEGQKMLINRLFLGNHNIQLFFLLLYPFSQSDSEVLLSLDFLSSTNSFSCKLLVLSLFSVFQQLFACFELHLHLVKLLFLLVNLSETNLGPFGLQLLILGLHFFKNLFLLSDCLLKICLDFETLPVAVLH